ncbi:MAG: hypothetical protein WD646_08910 [Actinomycetota bacterium]
MTVRRTRRLPIDGSIAEVSRVIESLSGQRRYRHQRTMPDGRSWEVVVQPAWWMLPTKLRASVVGDASDRLDLEVTTESQWFIVGDVFRGYDRQIAQFLRDLEMRLAETA